MKSQISADQWLRIQRARAAQATWLAKDTSNAWVIVFPEYKVAYVPVPKCANSSIRAALLPLVGRSPSSVDRIQEFNGFTKIKMKRFVELYYAEDWYVFAVVRNPYARYASAYLDKLVTRHEPLRPLVKMGLNARNTFSEYLEMIAHWPPNALNEHFATQSTILRRVEKTIQIETFKLENVEAAWARVRARIKEVAGVEICRLEQRNASKFNGRWQDIYRRKDIELVKKIAAQDFSRFDYSTVFPSQ